MGIVNASPDSFSDPGPRTLDGLVATALAQVEAGADIVDVGGESGVTHTQPVSAGEELARVLPLVERLVGEGVTVSVDTWKAEVAEAVLAAGASLINDVSGLRDPEVARACARHGAGLVVMHTRAEPKVKAYAGYDDVIADIREFLAERVALARDCGVPDDRIVVDPGPDFSKTPAETVEALRRLDELDLAHPLLLALSRKDFVGAITGRRPADRLAGTLGAVAALARHASILRVHDVAAVADFLAVWRALEDEGVAVPALGEALRREDPVA
ncbi:MAG: dihydropteroate synthase [Thermoleophilaceae bacterium]|jgi:dihydropteroate synthase|nr:dihydropteroate synthase [Thermoleophilaceae bacterium]